jgi:hypothetical protein
MKTALTWLSMVLAVVASITALLGARLKSPQSITLRAVQYDEYAENPIKGSIPEHQAGFVHAPELSQLTRAMRKQSLWSLATAICAAGSAASQIAAYVWKE